MRNKLHFSMIKLDAMTALHMFNKKRNLGLMSNYWHMR